MRISIQFHQYAPELSRVFLNGKESRIRLDSIDCQQIAAAKTYREKIAIVRALHLSPKSKAQGIFLTYEFHAGSNKHETRLLGPRSVVAAKLKKAREPFDLYGAGYTVPRVIIKKIHSIF